MLFSQFTAAQLCAGSLGLPIVNKTFGAGTNPGAPLSAASTNYQYVANDCPNDGFYTVRNNTTNCFSSSWHSLSGDHTGDANGYFMLVNASVQPGAFYVDTVRGLCSGTNFEFAAWVVNVLKQSACSGNGNRPDLTFTIERTDGTIIQAYSTGAIPGQPVPVWQQYGFFFNTPVGITDVVLRIVNNAPGGCGNDLALDDITFRPCGPLLSASINGFPANTARLCRGTSTSFDFSGSISSGFANPSFQWQESFNGGAYADIPGATGSTYTKNFLATAAPGVYTYHLMAAEASNMNNVGCRVLSASLSITVETTPVPVLVSNSPVCANNNIQLTASGGDQYAWTGPNGFTATGPSVTIPNAQPLQSGTYYVTVSSVAGCIKNDSLLVTIHPVPVAGVSFSTVTICEGETVQLSGTGGGTYQWSPATGLSSATIANPVASPVSTITYRLLVSNSFNCTDSAFSTVRVIRKPVANAGPDRATALGVPVILLATAGGDSIQYIWSPSLHLDNPLILQPTVSAPAGVYNYLLTINSSLGCGTATDQVQVLVYDGLFIPTGFTPNNDGRNDTWRIPALAIFPEFELSVYNRYGGRIFYTKNLQAGWNGKYNGLEQPAGVYIYLLSISQNGKKEIYKGTISLIR
jgi:gliding motility-associated-like protein